MIVARIMSVISILLVIFILLITNACNFLTSQSKSFVSPDKTYRVDLEEKLYDTGLLIFPTYEVKMNGSKAGARIAVDSSFYLAKDGRPRFFSIYRDSQWLSDRILRLSDRALSADIRKDCYLIRNEMGAALLGRLEFESVFSVI